MDQAMRSMLQFGLLGLALAGGLVAAVETRPITVLPFYGTLFVEVTNSLGQFSPTGDGCHDCNVSSISITIDSVTVHREGELNLTGGWLTISQATAHINTSQIRGIFGQLVGQASIPPGNINLVRLKVSSANATMRGDLLPIRLSVPSGKIDVAVNPVGHVKSGKSITVALGFQLSIICGGNGECRLRPVLVKTLIGPIE